MSRAIKLTDSFINHSTVMLDALLVRAAQRDVSNTHTEVYRQDSDVPFRVTESPEGVWQLVDAKELELKKEES